MCGIVSKVIIFDVKQMVQVKSLRVLVSNSQNFNGLGALPENQLACGCLDGSIKVYSVEEEEL